MAIDVNDRTDANGRQELVKAIPALVGSRTKSKRTYFRRIKALVTHLLAKAKQEMDEPGDSAASRLLYARLQEILDQKPTAKNIHEFVEIARSLDGDLNDSTCINGHILNALDQAADSWNSDGVSFTDYDELFHSVNLTGIFDKD